MQKVVDGCLKVKWVYGNDAVDVDKMGGRLVRYSLGGTGAVPPTFTSRTVNENRLAATF